MASCARNIRIKIIKIWVIGFQVTVKNVGMLFWDTVHVINRNFW